MSLPWERYRYDYRLERRRPDTPPIRYIGVQKANFGAMHRHEMLPAAGSEVPDVLCPNALAHREDL
jgi:hypothetical protein